MIELESSETFGGTNTGVEKMHEADSPEGGDAGVIAETSVCVSGLHRAGHTHMPRPGCLFLTGAHAPVLAIS